MRRPLPAYRHVICQSFCFAVLLLRCMPVSVKSDGHGKQQEKWEFMCTAEDQSIALDSYAREDASAAKAHEALGKTIWALRIDKELWYGELMDIHHGGSTNRAITFQAFMLAFPMVPSSQNETRWSQVRMLSNKQRPVQVLASPATDRNSYGGKSMLTVQCKLKQSNDTATDHDRVYQERCWPTPHSFISTTGNDRLRSVVLFHSKSSFGPMFFHPHDQCPWSNHSIVTGERCDEISAQMAPQEYGSSAGLSFFDEHTAIQTLQLSLNSSLLPSFSPRTLRDRIEGLLDERSAKFACNQVISKEFTAKSITNSPLQIYSSVIKGLNGGSHGFEVSPLHNFNLAPGQSAKLLISYQPDFKARISEGTLQLVTSAGVLSITVEAYIPTDILEFCQNAALIARAKSFTLQVCSMALFLVLLVFGKMLKQEVKNESDDNQWPYKSEAAKLCPGDSTSRSMVDGDSKKSSIYVSINVGYDESNQCGNFWSPRKAFELISAAMSCMIRFKVSCIPQASTLQDPASSSIEKKPNDPPSLTNSPVSKKKTPTHPRASNQATSTTSQSHGNSPLRSTAYLYKKDSAIPRLKIPKPSEVAEPESPTAALSDKEREKIKQKRKKGVNSLRASGMENGSDSGCSSPLSTPSSPLTRAASVSPVSTRSHKSLQKNRKPKSSNVSQWHSARDSKLQLSEGKFSESNRTTKVSNDLSDEQTRLLGKSRDANQGHSSKERSKNFAMIANCATLTVSHTFPAAGRRFSEERLGFQSTQEDEEKLSLSASSSSHSNLVSASLVASHARAPGSPLSSTSQSFPNSPLSCTSSPLTGSPFSTSSLPFSGSPFSSSPSLPGSPLLRSSLPFSDNPLFSTPVNLNEAAHDHCQNMWAGTTSPFFVGPSSSSSRRWRQGEPFQPQQMHGWNRPRSSKSNPYSRYDINSHHQKVNDVNHGPKDMVLYDMWGDHLGELNRRWQTSWLRKDPPFRRTRPPSSLPPLLKTPAFSIFSSDDPFSV